MILYTPPHYVEIAPGPELGFSRKYTIIVAGATGSTALVGAIINRRGKVVCEIHKTERNEEGCSYITLCDLTWKTCPRPEPRPE